MQIWVDADACPGVIKEILFRAAERKQLATVLVANQLIRHPPSPWIRAVQVEKGFDVADNHIVDAAAAGDLVITADIPLAAAVIEKGAQALNPRGIGVLTLSPGWVQTAMGGPSAPLPASASVAGMLRVIDGAPGLPAGDFLDYDGTPIPF